MLKKNDFVEIEYIGKIKNGEVFDTNIEEEAKKLGLEIKTKPLIICLGQNMILPAIDNFIIGKQLGTYTIELEPEKAFGKRSQELVKTFSLNAFKHQNIVPKPGMVFAFDNLIGKITSISGGRVVVDFNNPLAGKIVEYKITLKREIKDINEKIKALLFFYTKKEFEFDIKDKKLTVYASQTDSKLLKFFEKKFKEILDFDFEIKVKEIRQEKK
ncbi:MAG: peptidylprolyl isomerase [Candidatus Pacearchaeota archaeon]